MPHNLASDFDTSGGCHLFFNDSRQQAILYYPFSRMSIGCTFVFHSPHVKILWSCVTDTGMDTVAWRPPCCSTFRFGGTASNSLHIDSGGVWDCLCQHQPWMTFDTAELPILPGRNYCALALLNIIPTFSKENTTFCQMYDQNPAYRCVPYVWLIWDTKCFVENFVNQNMTNGGRGDEW